MLFLYIQYIFCFFGIACTCPFKVFNVLNGLQFLRKMFIPPMKAFPSQHRNHSITGCNFFIFAFVVSIICRSGKISVSKLQLVLCNSSSSIILSLLFSSGILILCSLLDCQHFFYSFNASDGSEGTTAGRVV